MSRRNRLNPDFLGGRAASESLRGAFDASLTHMAKHNRRIVGLSADLASSAALKEFASAMGRRYVEVGITEQNMVSMASGLAHEGYVPFTASYAAFSPGRNWEQIRTTICLNNEPVKIIGSHAGLNVGADGASHQMLEDITLMRSLPNMVVLAPGDAVEAATFARQMVQDDRPNYIRLPRCDLPTYNDVKNEFKIGPAYRLWRNESPIVGIFSTGSMTGESLKAVRMLNARGVMCELVHTPTIKPLDIRTILETAGRVDVVATVEEHQLNGGFGELVATTLLENGVTPLHFLRIGVNDEFGQSGTASELWRAYGIDAGSIVSKIMELIAG